MERRISVARAGQSIARATLSTPLHASLELLFGRSIAGSDFGRGMQGHKPGQQRCREQLANDGLEVRDASNQRVERRDIAEPGGRQGREAEIQRIANEVSLS